jgi:hypothetical protein
MPSGICSIERLTHWQKSKRLSIKRLFEGEVLSPLAAHADALMGDLSFSWLTATAIALETDA